MKKLSYFVVVLFVIGVSSSALAIDRAGKFSIGGTGGYCFGFGDAFEKQEVSVYYQGGFVYAKAETKVTYSFGGKMKYHASPNIALASEIQYQRWESDYELAISGHGAAKSSETGHWVGILGNFIYNFSPYANTCPYFTVGFGIYVPDEGDGKPGINGGPGVEHFFSPNMALDGGVRFHDIFTENKSTTYIQGYVGLNFFLGGGQ